MSSTPSAVYKIILIGDAGVGKTTCLAKFSEQYKKYEILEGNLNIKKYSTSTSSSQILFKTKIADAIQS